MPGSAVESCKGALCAMVGKGNPVSWEVGAAGLRKGNDARNACGGRLEEKAAQVHRCCCWRVAGELLASVVGECCGRGCQCMQCMIIPRQLR